MSQNLTHLSSSVSDKNTRKVGGTKKTGRRPLPRKEEKEAGEVLETIAFSLAFISSILFLFSTSLFLLLIY